jgi:hypothetical protein
MELQAKDLSEKNLKRYKLSVEDKNYIDGLSAITGVPSSTIREVFLGILIHSAIEKEDNFEISLPYLGKLIVSGDSQNISMKVYDSALSFFKTFSEGDENWIEDVILSKIRKNLSAKLELPIQ